MRNILNSGVRSGQNRYGGRMYLFNGRPVKRVMDFLGLRIHIEIEAGDTRGGVDADGVTWVHKFQYPYGEIPGTRTLADGEGVDVYIGPSKTSKIVYIVHQLKKSGEYDEDKVLLGFKSLNDAVACYIGHGPEWGLGEVEEMTWDQFVNGYLASNRPLK